MTSRERVQCAFSYEDSDCVPCDYFATPEIHEGMKAHFNVSRDDDLLDRLETDIRYTDPPYIGPHLTTNDDGSVMDVWGILRRPMPNEYGDYSEPVNFRA